MTSIKGKIKEISDTKVISDKFSKREFVLDITDNQGYPIFHKFELTQNSCDLIDKFNIGDEVEVHYNLRGREWVNKEGIVIYFNTTQAWKIAHIGKQEQQPTQPNLDVINTGNDGQSDLPF